MASFMPGEWGLGPTDQIGIIDAERKRKYAEALRQQQQPNGQMVGGIYVAPSITQRLAAAFSNYQGGKLMREADEKERSIYQAAEDKRRSAAERLAEVLKPKQVQDGFEQITPERQFDRFGSPIPGQDLTPAQGASKYKTVNPTPEDMLAAQIQYAQDLGDPNLLQQALAAQVNYAGQQQTRQDQREFQAQERIEKQKDRMLELQMRLEDQRLSRQERLDAQRELAQMQIEARRDLAAITRGNQSQPYYQPIQTSQGVMAFNARTGQLEPVQVNGQTVVGAQYDPSLQGEIAGAKEGGKVTGGAQAEAKVNLPSYVAEAEQTVKLVDDLLDSPGFKQAVGASRLVGVQKIPGTEARDFDIRLDQLKGKQFLQAFESLKGGGQITEVEGKKATDAISRMDAAASEEEFIKAAREFQSIIRNGVERAKRKAGVAVPATPAPVVKRFNPATGKIE
jgi:hypothetical protein